MSASSRRRFSAKIYHFDKKNVNLQVYVTDSIGKVIYDSKGLRVGKDYSKWNDVYLTLRGKYGARSTRTNPDDPSTSSFFVAAPIRSGQKIIGVLTVVKSKDSFTPFIDLAKMKIIRAGLLVLGVLILLGLFITGWITRPLNRLTKYADSVGKHKGVKLPELGGTEINTLGRAFEKMRLELEGKQYVEQYVQAFTHAIKSPLTVIKAAAELLEDEMQDAQRLRLYQNIQNESNRIQELVNRMLLLSSLENRSELEKMEDINIFELICDVVAGFKSEAGVKNIELNFQCEDSISINGDGFLISHSIANLLTNAIDFTPENGKISVTVKRDDRDIAIAVEDNGSGIPDYAIEKIFDRFYSLARPSDKRKSTGLGLPFVRETAELHRGRVVVSNNADGGVTAILYLPVNRSSGDLVTE